MNSAMDINQTFQLNTRSERLSCDATVYIFDDEVQLCVPITTGSRDENNDVKTQRKKSLNAFSPSSLVFKAISFSLSRLS
jgi:hypothetical protein